MPEGNIGIVEREKRERAKRRARRLRARAAREMAASAAAYQAAARPVSKEHAAREAGLREARKRQAEGRRAPTPVSKKELRAAGLREAREKQAEGKRAPSKEEQRLGRRGQPLGQKSGIGVPGTKISKALLGDLKEIGYGTADAVADYGTAAARDVADQATLHNVRALARGDVRDLRLPFQRTSKLLARDAKGYLLTLEEAIPAPDDFSGKGWGEDLARSKRFWSENPLIGALAFTPIGSKAARQVSRGTLESSIKRANPELPKRQVRKVARKESKLPGYAAAHGVEGGIKPRTLKGEFGEAQGRAQSRTPIGRAGQRAYDRGSQFVETRFGPGAKFSTSQRAARMKERQLHKERNRTDAEIARLERVMRKGIGRLGRSPSGREALIATLEAPRGLAPRQAVEAKLADLRSTIERPRSADEASARLAKLDRELTEKLRPLVDAAFPVGARRVEQARRNILPHTRGKRAARALETKLELEGIGSKHGGGSVLADAYERVQAQVVALAAKPDADPIARKVAALIEERNRLRDAVSDPEVVFGDAPGDFGVTGASPAAAKRLAAQVVALERALADGTVDADDFARAVDAAETLARQADEHAKTVLGMSDEELASRRNVVARRYAERGLLPEGVEPEARGFFPHREEYESVGGRMGAPTLAATGGVVGRPTPGRAFERRQNELRLYEQGRVQTNPRVLSNTVRQRERFAQTHEGRKYLYEQGAPIRRGEPVPEGSMLVRNPDASPKTIPASVRAAIENPERYAELAERTGAFPEAETFGQWVDSWLYRGRGPEPEWLADLDNVRAVPEGVVRALLADVFRSAPRGSIAAIFGTLNSLARATTIYTPYGGARYVARNTPQNMILLALTQPKAFLNLRQAVSTLRRKEPELYAAIRAEAGTIQAAAGLPELAGRRQSRAQRVEGATTDVSRKIAGGLGEVTDEPWRVSSWLEYARKYDFKKPDDWRRLLNSDDPALVRVRDDIAQRVRDDMIDFDALSPFERETLSRFLFIYPFVRGALKWPFMYLREYPVRTALLSLIAAQHEREETPGRATSVLEAGRTEIAGREVDLGWLNPAAPAAGTIEDVAAAVGGTDTDRVNWRPLAGTLAPQYRSLVDAFGFGEPTEQIGRAFVPGYSTGEKIGRGGGAGEQALRLVGSTVDYIEPSGDSVERARLKVREERATVMPLLRGKVDTDDQRYIGRAYRIAEQMAVLRAKADEQYGDGEPRLRAVLAAEARLMGRIGVFDKDDVAYLVTLAERGSYEDVKSRRAKLVASVYENAYLKTTRYAREQVGYQSKGP